MTESAQTPFADRLARLVGERGSQVCLGLDPDPNKIGVEAEHLSGPGTAEIAARAGEAVGDWCERLIAAAGSHCVAIKPQLACFERLGAPGWTALQRAVDVAQAAGLLVIADGKRGDVPVSASAYAQALFGSTPTPWGKLRGLGADAATINPLLGSDAIEPLIEGAARVGAGLFALVRTSNPGAADLFDVASPDRPLHERIAEMITQQAPRLAGEDGLSGLGAVVGATEPRHLTRIRELMPDSIFLLPGVGAQGGDASALGDAFRNHRAGAIVTASRSIAGAEDPAAAADSLRAQVWEVACQAQSEA